MSQEEKTVRKKDYAPDDEKDYRLAGVRIEDAENGVSIKCEYELKPEVKDKMRANKQDIPWSGMSDNTETHVFEKEKDARAFIIEELDKLFGTKAEGADDKEGDEENDDE